MHFYCWLKAKYPYRGLFGWATLCVWSFVIAEMLWHLSRFVRRYDFLEIPLIVPYAPIALLIDPRNAMLNHRSIFFVALANWFGIFIVGAIVSYRRANAAVVGGAMLLLVIVAAAGRVIFTPPMYVP